MHIMAKRSKPGSKTAAAATVRHAWHAPLTISRPELIEQGSDADFRRLVHLAFAFAARHDRVRAGHARFLNLAGLEYTVLISIGHLAAEGECAISTVAAHLMVSGALITRIANSLVARELVTKSGTERDHRRVVLNVSKKGFAYLAELAPLQRQVNDIQFAGLTKPEFRELIRLFKTLVANSDRAIAFQDYLFRTHGSVSVALDQDAEQGKADRKKRA
jgi:DNA-binding MarR family transcriptional regulator